MESFSFKLNVNLSKVDPQHNVAQSIEDIITHALVNGLFTGDFASELESVTIEEHTEPSYVQVTLDDGEELGIFLNGDIGGDSLYTRIRSAQINDIGHDADKYTIEEIYIR